MTEDKIQDPWLIQRANFSDRDYKSGIDSIIQFDYMGYAEYEFGTLPKSLEKIRDNISSYTYLDIPIKDKVITVFCPEAHKSQAKQYLTDISDSKFRTKGYHAFDGYINEDEYLKDKTDFWWDLDNNIMFWKKNPEFEEKFKGLIQNKAQ